MAKPGPPKQDLVPVVIRMPDDLHRAIKAKAVEDERTMAQTIRHALRLYVSASSDEELDVTASRTKYDPRTYGAVGDGITDDTAAYQAAIDATWGPSTSGV